MHGRAPLTGGGWISYFRYGAEVDSAEPILLLRPMIGDATSWGEFLVRLTGEVRRPVLALDYRGTGASSGAPFGLTTRLMAEDVRETLQHLGLSRVSVFGLSLGGMVATWLAYLAPSLVSGLCLASTPIRGTVKPAVALELASCLARPSHSVAPCLARHVLCPEYRKYYPNESARIGRRLKGRTPTRATLARYAIAARMHDASRIAHRIVQPALLLAGGCDRVVGPASVRALAEQLPNAAFDCLRGVGHDLTLEAPSDTARRVGAFFR